MRALSASRSTAAGRSPIDEKSGRQARESVNQNLTSDPQQLQSSASGLIRADRGDPATKAFEIAVTSFFIDAADLLGVPKSLAAIYGICFASPEPLSFADLTDRLHISSGSISQGLRVLTEVGALKIASPEALALLSVRICQGVARRRDYFEPDIELRKLVARFIESRLQQQVSSGRMRLQAILKTIPGSNGSAKILKERLKALQTWHDKSRALMPVVKTFLKLT